MFSSMLDKLTGTVKETEEEKAQQFDEKFKELKKKCEIVFKDDPNQIHSDSSMHRFLRAYQAVDAAVEAMAKYNKWRQDYNVDKLAADDPDILEQMAERKVHLLRARDHIGRPIVHIAVRKHNTSERDLDKLTKFTIYMLEQTCDRINEETIDNMCIVFDLKDFSLSNMDYQYVKRLISLLGRYYPERLGTCLILNYPVLFMGCWTVIRPWLNEVTASKVTFVSGDEQLVEYLDPDELPPSED